jgi:RimJ/RimL family protein N-acetyltransferase
VTPAPEPALLADLARMPDELRSAARRVGPDWALVRDAGGGFALLEQVWHLADLEREGFGVRIERLLGEAAPFLPDFDGARRARERDYRRLPLADGLRAFADARHANLERLRAVADAEWDKSGEQEGVGAVRLGDLPRRMAEHDASHREEIASLEAGLRRVPSPPALKTERLCLEPFDFSHEEALLSLFNDREVGLYLWDGEPVARETVRALIADSLAGFRDQGLGHFVLALRADPSRIVGFAGLRAVGASTDIEVLYALAPPWWKTGLATEAARAVLRHAFETAGLTEVWAGADPPNVASFRVMERLGMSLADERTIGGRPARYYRLDREAWRG